MLLKFELFPPHLVVSTTAAQGEQRGPRDRARRGTFTIPTAPPMSRALSTCLRRRLGGGGRLSHVQPHQGVWGLGLATPFNPEATRRFGFSNQSPVSLDVGPGGQHVGPRPLGDLGQAGGSASTGHRIFPTGTSGEPPSWPLGSGGLSFHLEVYFLPSLFLPDDKPCCFVFGMTLE